MNEIPQRRGSDCAVCCIAMITGRTYEDIAEHCTDNELENIGLQDEQMLEIARQHGVIFNAERTHRTFERNAIVIVRSINRTDVTHCIYWNADEKKLFDPSTKNRYTEIPTDYFFAFTVQD